MVEQNSGLKRWRPSKVTLEVILLAALYLLCLILAHAYDAPRRLHDLAESYQGWFHEDLYFALTLLPFFLGLFAFRRWTDTQRQLGRQRQAKEAIRRNEARFRSLIENSRDVITVLDMEGTIHYASPAVRNVLGYEPQEMAGANVFDYLHPADAPIALQSLSMVVDTPDAAQSLVYRYRDAEGSWCYLEGKGTATINEEGKTEIVLNSRDVTRQRLMSQKMQFQLDQLVEAEKQARSLARFPEENRGPVLRLDHQGRLLYSNQPAGVMLDGVSVGIGELLPAQYRETLESVLESGKVQNVEIQAGERCWLVTYCPVEGEEYVNLYGSEITDLKAAENQLHMSQKLESVGLLAGGIAHDFNNILTIIKCQSELLLHALDVEAPLIRKLQVIDKAAERAASLTRQLLAFSRRQVLEPTVLEIDALVADMDDLLRRLVEENIELVVNGDGDDLWHVRADRGQIEQVLVNLVVNARDAMPEGGRITIEARNVNLDENDVREKTSVNPGPYVLLSVSDTGCGMDEQTRARIFEPFFSTKASQGGSGLGLSTCYGIVKQSGGNIWVYSEPGLGTTFKIYLPQVLEEADPVAVRGPEPVEHSGGTETVLLVEDDETIREIVMEVLEKKGYSVLNASNGLEALTICDSQDRPIDLLLTDVVMPKMSGGRLFEEVVKRYPDVQALFMSGYSADAVSGIDPDMALLTKPFTLSHLLSRVREVLDTGMAA